MQFAYQNWCSKKVETRECLHSLKMCVLFWYIVSVSCHRNFTISCISHTLSLSLCLCAELLYLTLQQIPIYNPIYENSQNKLCAHATCVLWKSILFYWNVMVMHYAILWYMFDVHSPNKIILFAAPKNEMML